MIEILHLLNLPAERVSSILHVQSVGPLQYAIGGLTLFISGLLSLFLFIYWQRNRHGIYLAASLVCALAGSVLAFASAWYVTPWVYVSLIAIIAGDVVWRLARKNKIELPLLVWLAAAFFVTLVSVGSATAVGWHARKQADTTVSSRLKTGTDGITALKAHTLSSMTSAGNQGALLTALNTPATEISLRQDYGLDFLFIRSADGSITSSSLNAPAFSEFPTLNTASVLVSTTRTSAVVGAIPFGKNTLIGGTFLGDATLKQVVGFNGVTMNAYGREATGSLAADELAVASSADIRDTLIGTSGARLVADTGAGRTYVGTAELENGIQLLAPASDPGAAKRSRNDSIVGVSIGVILTLAALIVRRKKGASELKGFIFAGLWLVAIGAYAAWSASVAVATFGTAYRQVTVDPAHPALVSQVYVSNTATGVSLTLDTAGANVASLDLHFTVPADVTASNFALNRDFCTTVSQAPSVSNGILSFSCGTSDPATHGQLALLGTVSLKSGTVSLSSGTATARRAGGKTEPLPVR
jgi:hypothetical protein